MLQNRLDESIVTRNICGWSYYSIFIFIRVKGRARQQSESTNAIQIYVKIKIFFFRKNDFNELRMCLYA